MTKKVPTAHAKIGDELAEPVVHGEGQMLLVAGTRLEAQHLELLRQRGVLLVTLVGDGEDSVDEAAATVDLDPDRAKQIVIEEARWFGDARKDPVMAEVFRWKVQQRTRAGGGDGGDA